ncbi:MAG: TrkH family potassium uptake protein [Hyphomicrobiaceae bacterium]|nr:TrkH family potassium uptake protein [Hyphomicrobiaceae bacterium]MCC0023451.1 TrkH family potassium uptake protein [Hyphomicrobiaceae bacterium]
MRAISLIAALLFAFCLAPLGGLLAALSQGDRGASETFLLMAFLYLFVAGLAILATWHRRSLLTRGGLFPLALVMWLVLAVAAMPPYIAIEGHSPAVAFYEATSAIVTNGQSLMPVEEMRWPMMVYRAVSSWLGGLLTLMLGVYVLGRYEVGGTTSRDLRLVLRDSGKVGASIRGTLLEIGTPYVLVTLVGLVALLATRVSPGSALIATLGAVSTSGLVAPRPGAGIFNSQMAETVLLVLMLVGATSILTLRAALGRTLRQAQDRWESLAFLVLIVAIIAFLAVARQVSPQIAHGSWFSLVFDVFSTATTTGVVHDLRDGLQVPYELAIILALIGGTAFSTSGGLKVFRIVAMFRHSYDEIRSLIYPNRMIAFESGSEANETRRMNAVWSALFAGLVFILVLTTLLAMTGHHFEAALNLAVGSFTGTASLVDSSLFATTDGRVSVISLMLLAIAGLVGRLEILLVLVAFGRLRGD